MGMNLADCYRALGLREGASFAEVKASYRRLARQYHPDVNPNNQRAKDKFILLAEAYKRLSQVLPHDELTAPSSPTNGKTGAKATPNKGVNKGAKTPAPKPPRPKVQTNPGLSLFEQQLKQDAYDQLQILLRTKRFPRAIALVEGLASRMPNDSEARQWQAIAYQQWGRHLIHDQEFDKAKIYLKKALRTDPHNKSLWAEVRQDFQQLARRVQKHV